MALSLIDLLDLPSSERSEANIILNIPSLRRKCDLFYHLADKEAFQLLQHCKLFRSSPDLAIPDALNHLCILLRGQVSLCHKTAIQKAEPSKNVNEKETKSGSKDGAKNGKKVSAGVSVLAVVTLLLERRKTLQEKEKRKSMGDYTQENEDDGSPTPSVLQSQKEMLSRTSLYGKPVVQYSEGSYFGGPDTSYTQNAGETDQYTYVADTSCVLLTIPHSLHISIMNYHYLNTIRDKESLLKENEVTKWLTKPQQSSMLHEILEEHFVHGNVMTTKGEPADVVYLVKSGFARIFLHVKVPKVNLPEAVQHLPSTQLQQRLRTVKYGVMDVGPGEFVGGLEQLCGEKNYMFTIVTTCETVAYNMRAEQFKDLILKKNSKSLQLLTNDMKSKWKMRRELADFSLCAETDNIIICNLLREDTDDEEAHVAHIDAIKSELPMKKSVPHYMQVTRDPDEVRQSLRPPNRGPFADRVRNRMIELGFKSRRGT